MTIVRRVPRLPTSSWPGFVPAIHVLPVGPPEKDVDARNVGVASPERPRWPSRHRTRVVSPQPHTRGKCGERRNIIRSDDGRASGSCSLIPDETQSGLRRTRSGVLSSTTAPPQRHHRDLHEKDHSRHCSRRPRLHIGACRRSRRAGSLFQGTGDGGCCQQLERLLYPAATLGYWMLQWQILILRLRPSPAVHSGY